MRTIITGPIRGHKQRRPGRRPVSRAGGRRRANDARRCRSRHAGCRRRL